MKKAENVENDEELDDKAKLTSISKMVKKAKTVKKKETKVVVAKHANRAIKGRPKGVKGRYKMVDSRMKKDLKSEKRASKKSRSKKR